PTSAGTAASAAFFFAGEKRPVIGHLPPSSDEPSPLGGTAMNVKAHTVHKVDIENTIKSPGVRGYFSKEVEKA
ncbi:MAG: hypothetical protein VX155_04380, partial [Planctomycetota bacterium]|nr:hypothetical protein [Planctomycetota bacterium]